MQSGGVEVQALQNRPSLTQWVLDYWNGFQVLSGSRSIHQGGVGPIPLTEIVAWMEAIYLRDVDERLKTIRMIQSLDSVYVMHVNDKAKRKADSQKKSKSNPRNR
jgi:hypothetical protein